jgi:hypothetical protein
VGRLEQAHLSEWLQGPDSCDIARVIMSISRAGLLAARQRRRLIDLARVETCVAR